jgi:hypothetical protein
VAQTSDIAYIQGTKQGRVKRNTERKFVIVGAALLLLTICSWIFFCHCVEDVLEVGAAAFTIIFFGYKLVVGWLFLNLNIDLETDRRAAEGELDDLVLSMTLEKGSIDGFWLKDIDVRVSELAKDGEQEVKGCIKPYGMKKTHASDGKVNWGKDEYPDYVLSPKEKTTFSAYTKVNSHAVILLEVNVLGTRPFYGLECKPGDKPVQWRASTISLPCKSIEK